MSLGAVWIDAMFIFAQNKKEPQAVIEELVELISLNKIPDDNLLLFHTISTNSVQFCGANNKLLINDCKCKY